MPCLWMSGGIMWCDVGSGWGSSHTPPERHLGLSFSYGSGLGVSGQRELMLPVPVPCFEPRRADLLIGEWDYDRDLYVDVVGTSPWAGSYWAHFEPRGAVERTAALMMTSYREVLLHQHPRVLFRPFADYTFGGLHIETVNLFRRFRPGGLWRPISLIRRGMFLMDLRTLLIGSLVGQSCAKFESIGPRSCRTSMIT